MMTAFGFLAGLVSFDRCHILPTCSNLMENVSEILVSCTTFDTSEARLEAVGLS